MKELLRTASGQFVLADSLRLDEIRERMQQGREEEFLMPLESFFMQYPEKRVMSDEDRYLHNGNPLTYPVRELAVRTGDLVRMYDSVGRFVGLYKVQYSAKEKVHLTAYKMFG